MSKQAGKVKKMWAIRDSVNRTLVMIDRFNRPVFENSVPAPGYFFATQSAAVAYIEKTKALRHRDCDTYEIEVIEKWYASPVYAAPVLQIIDSFGIGSLTREEAVLEWKRERSQMLQQELAKKAAEMMEIQKQITDTLTHTAIN